MNLNEWNHIAMTYDGSNLNLYINGELDSSQAVTGTPFISNHPIKIGKEMDVYGKFEGEIDEVRIWNVARTEQQIQTNLYNNLTGKETGLVGYWNFNEGKGIVATDLSNNINHGIISGATWVETNKETGIITDENTSLNINVLANDINPDNGTITIQSFDRTNTQGLVTINADNTIKYNPNGKFNYLKQGEIASDTFTYTIKNSSGQTDTATVTVTLKGLNDNIINGTSGNDTLKGINNNDIIKGFVGNDNVQGLKGNDTLIGSAGNDTLNGGSGADRMVGGLGNDSYYVDNTGDRVIENANEGTDTVRSSITYTLGNNLENLILTGIVNINGTGNSLNNRITGNSGNNRLNGGAGNDTLIGGSGADSLIGGAGNDVYIIDTTTDTITENLNEGTDTVQSSVTYTLGNNLENLTLTGTAAINGTGNILNNVITGNSANNTLNGGDGIDTLIGGAGNDVYVIDTTTDTITENLNEGTDTVQSSVTYTLGNNLENLTLTGTTAINGTGNSLNNIITGNSVNNTLNGGDGIDTLIGGTGNDVYVIDTTTDTITENLNEGTDTVQSSVTYTLGNNLENLTLTGTTAINGTGNSLNNTITGNTANNTLTGGFGIDALIGGVGNDVYVIDTTTDTITENLNEGTDTVQSSVTYTLGNNLENLTLTGTTAINGTGNSLNNVITGNSGNNSLTAGAGNDTLTGGAGNDILSGGTGADRMTGGKGNDLYYVDNTGDRIIEKADEGIDTVRSSITYTLGNNLENLILTGTGNINGTGNSLNNHITGNTANNRLNGGDGNDTLTGGAGNDTLIGGMGNDILTGGAGNDFFRFNSPSEGIDRLTDFNVIDDTILISRNGFGGGLTLGVLSANQFRLGSSATTPDHRFFYNANNGGLFFDVDGNEANSAVRIATLSTGLVLTNTDIVLI
jgi:Ca2+-binding RTX toxin-like protein